MAELITIVIYISVYLGLIATSFYVLSFLDYGKKERKFFSEENLPSVSVLIPAFNEEQSIARTIESILRTDYPKNKFEIIVIDDGSTDKTPSIAEKFADENLKVFTKKNGGKGSALNLGISKAKGEIIFTMDADTFAEPQSVRNMVHYFTNERVMAVTPAMLVYKPRNIWQRIQRMEYFLGLFLRKAFATLNAVYITPGAFSAYRKKFFEQHGGYDEENVTEDIEMSLRIQYEGYFVDNSPDSPAYTIVPQTFGELLVQRRRWYFGYIKNVWKYREIIGRKYGDLGMFVIPIGILSIILAIFVTLYLFFDTLFRVKNELIFLSGSGVSFDGFFEINYYFWERLFFLLVTNPIFLSIFFFIGMMGFYMYWASKKVGKSEGLVIDLYLFFILFAMLFSFWWTISVVYALFSKSVKWK